MAGDQPAAIIYTSGTTARPKGVTHTQETLMALATARGLEIENWYTVLPLTQMMHISGIAYCLASLLAGATVALLPAFDAAAALDCVERLRCNYIFGLPPFMQALIDEQRQRPRDVASLEDCAVGGDATPVAVQDRFEEVFSIPLRELYGMTESGVIMINSRERLRPGSLGVADGRVTVRVVDGDGCELPRGATGELAVQSPSNFTGYWNDPESTQETLRNGWLHTGDLARMDEEGFCWFEGRKKEIIVRGGSNISPQEVEEAFHHHPAVREAAVTAMPDPIDGEKVVAFVSLWDGHTAAAKELFDSLRPRLADYKLPEAIFFLSRLPHGPTGKVQRQLLRQLLLELTGDAAGAMRHNP
jgi:long-chain acyl-CoA synthetase